MPSTHAGRRHSRFFISSFLFYLSKCVSIERNERERKTKSLENMFAFWNELLLLLFFQFRPDNDYRGNTFNAVFLRSKNEWWENQYYFALTNLKFICFSCIFARTLYWHFSATVTLLIKIIIQNITHHSGAAMSLFNRTSFHKTNTVSAIIVINTGCCRWRGSINKIIEFCLLQTLFVS